MYLPTRGGGVVQRRVSLRGKIRGRSSEKEGNHSIKKIFFGWKSERILIFFSL